MAVTLQQVASEQNWRAQVAALFTSALATLATVPTFLRGSVVYDPPNINNNAQAQTTVTVTGAVLGNVAVASFSLDTQGIVVTANVSAADTVTVTFRNATGGAIDLASGTLSAVVFS